MTSVNLTKQLTGAAATHNQAEQASSHRIFLRCWSQQPLHAADGKATPFFLRRVKD